MGTSINDLIANFNPSGFALGNQQRQANVESTQATTQAQQQQTESEALKQKIMQQQLQDSDILRRAYVNTDGNPENVRQYMLKNGISGQGFQSWQQHDLDLRQKAAVLTKEQREQEAATHSQAADIIDTINSAKDPQYQSQLYQHALPRLQQLAPDVQWKPQYDSDYGQFVSGALGHASKVLEQQKTQAATTEAQAKTAESQQKLAGEQRTLALQELSSVSTPEDYATWKAKHTDISAPATYSQAWVGKQVRAGVPVEKQPEYDISALKAKSGITGTDDFSTVFLPAYAAKLGKSIQDLSPDEKMQSFSAYAQAKADPEVRASLLASRATMEAVHQMQLSQQPTPEQARDVAQDVIGHKMAPEQLSAMFGGFGATGQAFKRMVYHEAKQIDPEFNWEQASAEYGLTKSQGFQNTVRYIDSVQSSLPRLVSAAQALGNTDVRSVNALLNAGKDQFNGINLKKFQTDRLLLSDEVAKILQGGGTGSGTSDAKLKQAESIFRSSDSPRAIATAASEVQQLIGYRRKALTRGTYLENQQPQSEGAAHQAGEVKRYNGADYKFNGTQWVKQ